MNKRYLAVITTILMAISLFAGCSGGNQAAPEASTAPAGSTADSADTAPAESPKGSGTVSIIASKDWVKDNEYDLADKYEEETGITVDYQIVPADQYPNLLMTKLNSGECADIFMNQSGAFDLESQLQLSKNAVDLSGEEWVSRFEQAVKDQVSVDGKVYGITIWDQGDSYAFIYNKKIFSDLGLSEPTSYEEFKKVCQAIKDSGVIPIYECVADGWHHVLPFTESADAYNRATSGMIDLLNDNQTKLVDQPVFETMLNQYKEIVDLGYWGDNYMSNEYNNIGPALASGEYAMTINMMGRVNLITEADPSVDESNFGFFPYPYADNKKIAETPTGPSKFVFSGGKNIEGAKQYIAFLARPENLQYMIDNEGSFNSLPFSGLNSTYSQEYKDAQAKYKDGTTVIYQTAVKYVNPQWMDIGKDLTSFLMGEKDAKQVLESIDSRRADQASAAGDGNWK